MDIDHLIAMETRDREISENRESGTRVYRPLEMSAIVPVAGLILARFHMNLCELTTVIELWETNKTKSKATAGEKEAERERERR